MKFDLLYVLYPLLVIYSWISTVRLIFKVLRSWLLLNKVRKNNEIIIKGNSTVYRIKNYIIAIITEAFFMFIMCRLLTIDRLPLLFTIFVGFSIANIAVSMIIHIIAIFKENNVYLTNKGLIYFIGRFEFSKCRFAWESSDNSDDLSNTLHVYPPKDKFPFTATFDEQIENAHKIVSDNSV